MNGESIPSEFYSFESNSLFENCIECEKYLLDDGTEYLIEKSIKNYKGFEAKDVVFDYAICLDCAEKLRQEISSESWEKMTSYFQENLDLSERIEMTTKSIDEHLKNCIIKKINVSECYEYRVFAHCNGKRLNMQNPPYTISGEVMDELLPLLSDKTIDEMNGFFNKHFSPDPSLFEPTPSLILI
ncbi:MAG: hypothetical protein AAF620_17885 [Bacteroidota bacterium]